MTTIDVTLPHALSIDALKVALEWLPIRSRDPKDEHGQHEYVVELAPRDQSGVRVDSRRLQQATPEAIGAFAALLKWIHGQNEAFALLDVRGKALAAADVMARLRASSAAAREVWILPLSEIQLPSYSDDPAAPQWASDRAAINQKAEILMETVIEGLKPFRNHDQRSEGVDKAIAEFLWEGLLNVQQHAFANNTPEHARLAWIVGSVIPASIVPKLYHRPRNAPGVTAEEWWFEQHRQAGASHFVEIAIVDAGMSIPGSLGPTYDRLREQGQPRKGGTYLARRRRHDAIIEWALSPFGSRKGAREHPSDAVATAWRGLYRTLYRASRVQGAIVVRSGFGALGAAVFRESKELRWEPRGESYANRPWPFTALVIRLALPSVTATHRPTTSRGELALDKDQIVWVPTSVRKQLLAEEARRSDEGLATYAEAVASAIADRVHRQSVLHATKPLEKQIVGVVHPAVRISRLPFGSTVPEGLAHAIVSEVRSEDLQANQLLALMFAEHAFPGSIPVHLFLDVSDEVLDMTQQMFGTVTTRTAAARSGELPAPRVVGVCRPGSREIRWLIHVEGHEQEAQLAANGYIELYHGTPRPSWWRCLETDFGFHESRTRPRDPKSGARLTDDGSSALRLENPLPDRVAWETVQFSLNGLVVRLAQAGQEAGLPWYWRAKTVGEVVRTSTQRRVNEYIKPHTLCTDEPLLELSLAIQLQDRILAGLKAGTTALLVPSTGSVSFLLLKRLHYRMTNRDRIEIVHPDDLFQRLLAARGNRESCSILVFADVLRTGETVKRYLHYLGARWPAEKVFVCFSLRAKSHGALPWDIPTYSLVEWPATRELEGRDPSGSQERRVDPHTMEELDPETAREAQAYRSPSLVWRRPDRPGDDVIEGPEAELPKQARYLQYGLQHVGGRVQLVRFATQDMYENESGLREALVKAIVASLREANVESATDIVLFARDESFLWLRGCLRLVASDVGALLRGGGSSWRGRVFISRVPVSRDRERQILGLRRLNPKRDAQLVDAGGSSRTNQLSLLESVPALQPGYQMVLVDQAAVTGRTIRDFVLNMPNQPSLPSAVHILPLVDKLSPSEELFLHRAASLAAPPSSDNGPSTSSTTPVRVLFRSLYQLRIHSYLRFEHTALYRLLDSIARRAEELPIPEVHEWAKSVRSLRIEPLLRGVAGHREQFPICQTTVPLQDVSVAAVYFRHLLAVYQQGYPLQDELMEVLKELTDREDPSLLTVFALEPDLFSDTFLVGPLLRDIAQLAHSILQSELQDGVRSNALWVLFLEKRLFVEKAKDIARRCVFDPTLAPQWLALLIAGVEGTDRHDALASAREAFARPHPPLSKNQHKRWLEVRATLEAERRAPLWDPPHSDEAARHCIYKLLREARPKHGPGFGSWRELRVALASYDTKPGFISPAIQSNERWNQARGFLDDHLIPAMQAVEMLVKGPGGTERQELVRAAREARVAFERARHYAAEVRTNPELAPALLAAWKTVLKNTLLDSVDHVLSLRKECVLGTASLDSIGSLEYFLPLVVIEPVALLLHALAHEFSGEQGCSVTLVAARTSSRGESQTHRTAMLLEHLRDRNGQWKRQGTLPLFWNGPQNLRVCYSIFVENIKRHSAIPPQIGVRVSAKADALIINLSNHATKPVAIGSGLVQAQNLTKEMGGTLRYRHNTRTGVFMLAHSIPVTWLKVTPLGSSR